MRAGAALCFATIPTKLKSHNISKLLPIHIPSTSHPCPEPSDRLLAWGVKPMRITPWSPWQYGVAERWVLSVRRELLDHVVVNNAAHLHRLLHSCIAYYHDDRCHLSLGKDAPNARAMTPRPSPSARVVALPRVGGIHHRYEWHEERAAA